MCLLSLMFHESDSVDTESTIAHISRTQPKGCLTCLSRFSLIVQSSENPVIGSAKCCFDWTVKEPLT